MEKEILSITTLNGDTFKKGDKVYHSKFGCGVISQTIKVLVPKIRDYIPVCKVKFKSKEYNIHPAWLSKEE